MGVTDTNAADAGTPAPRPTDTAARAATRAAIRAGAGSDRSSRAAVTMTYTDWGVLGAEIERLRKVADLTVTALAGLVGTSPAVLRRYERGGNGPVELHVLRALAAALGTTVGALFDALPVPTPGTAPGAARVTLADAAPVVLLPTYRPVPGHASPAALWHLTRYLPRPLGQRWERAGTADPARSVSPAVLDWAGALTGHPLGVLGSAGELTGARSWYLGPVRPLPRRHP